MSVKREDSLNALHQRQLNEIRELKFQLNSERSARSRGGGELADALHKGKEGIAIMKQFNEMRDNWSKMQAKVDECDQRIENMKKECKLKMKDQIMQIEDLSARLSRVSRTVKLVLSESHGDNGGALHVRVGGGFEPLSSFLYRKTGETFLGNLESTHVDQPCKVELPVHHPVPPEFMKRSSSTYGAGSSCKSRVQQSPAHSVSKDVATPASKTADSESAKSEKDLALAGALSALARAMSSESVSYAVSVSPSGLPRGDNDLVDLLNNRGLLGSPETPDLAGPAAIPVGGRGIKRGSRH
jgi:hypothetical protein